MYYIVITKKNNEMCAITFLKARTLSCISSARVTFYIKNCFYSELLKIKISQVPNLKKLYLEIFKYHIEKKYVSIIFEVKRQKKMFRRKKNFDCKSPMKWPTYYQIYTLLYNIYIRFNIEILDLI